MVVNLNFQNGGCILKLQSWISLTGIQDNLRRRTDGLKCRLKFPVDLIYSVEDIAISIFLTFGLKLPNHAHFWGVLGGLIP